MREQASGGVVPGPTGDMAILLDQTLGPRTRMVPRMTVAVGVQNGTLAGFAYVGCPAADSSLLQSYWRSIDAGTHKQQPGDPNTCCVRALFCASRQVALPFNHACAAEIR